AIATIGDSAVRAWAAKDNALLSTFEEATAVIANVEAAVDASGQFPELAEAVGEALVQLEHGSVALLMDLTALAADAARRTLEVVYFTAFLRHGPIVQRSAPIRLADWKAGAALYSFVRPLQKYFSDPSKAYADVGNYG